MTAAVEQSPRAPDHEVALGRDLARLHAQPHHVWGGGAALIGACPVDPTPAADGPTFYADRLTGLAERCGMQPRAGAGGGPAGRPPSSGRTRPRCTATSGGATCSGAPTDGPGSSTRPCTAATPRRTWRCSPCSGRYPSRLRRAYAEVRPPADGWEDTGGPLPAHPATRAHRALRRRLPRTGRVGGPPLRLRTDPPRRREQATIPGLGIPRR